MIIFNSNINTINKKNINNLIEYIFRINLFGKLFIHQTYLRKI